MNWRLIDRFDAIAITDSIPKMCRVAPTTTCLIWIAWCRITLMLLLCSTTLPIEKMSTGYICKLDLTLRYFIPYLCQYAIVDFYQSWTTFISLLKAYKLRIKAAGWSNGIYFCWFLSSKIDASCSITWLKFYQLIRRVSAKGEKFIAYSTYLMII